MEYIETAVSKSFTQEVALPDHEFNLARAGLLFARCEYPELDCGWYLGQIDLIACDISQRISADDATSERLRAINTYLFGELGYSGNLDDYYDPRNSYLNEVIDRRVGLPITLSILYLELAHRLQVDAHGISFPGHFLVGVATEQGAMIVDAFDRGATLPRDVFIRRLHERAENGPRPEALAQAMRPASKLEILLRQLRNLKSIYSERGDVRKSLNIINHMLAAYADLLPELLERAALYDTLGYAHGAAADYERALEILPAGMDRDEIAERLQAARSQAQRLH